MGSFGQLRHMRPSEFGFGSLPPVTPVGSRDPNQYGHGNPAAYGPGSLAAYGPSNPAAYGHPAAGAMFGPGLAPGHLHQGSVQQLRRPDTMTTIAAVNSPGSTSSHDDSEEEPDSVSSSSKLVVPKLYNSEILAL